jgi:hypothetical protein
MTFDLAAIAAVLVVKCKAAKPEEIDRFRRGSATARADY